jgi:hypothetical protein
MVGDEAIEDVLGDFQEISWLLLYISVELSSDRDET